MIVFQYREKEEPHMKLLSYGRTILIRIIAGCAICLTLVSLLPYAPYHFLPSGKELSEACVARLRDLGAEALRSRDVPVASVLMFGDSIIGEGFNTVLRDGNVGGHAEINAMSDAMRRVGPTMFSALNRDSLILISTFEPCPMCRGAILEHHIKKVQFLKPKPLFYLLREDLRSMRYRWMWTQLEPEALQDSLFRSHPDYSQDIESHQ
jgi:tRNA(Arg) A34 adenosine deaminase TadA